MIIDLPPKLDAAWLEKAISGSAEDSDDTVVLCLRGWEDVDGLGEGRLLQWMRKLEQSQKRVILDLGQSLPVLEDDPRHPLWPMFRDRLGAMILVDAAAEILDPEGNDRRPEVHAFQRSQLGLGGEVGFGRERGLVRIDRIGAPPAFRAFTNPEDDLAHLRSRVGQLLDALNLDELVGVDQRRQLASFVHEIVANTRMHACDDLDGAPVDGFRFAQVRRLSVNRQRGMERLVTGEGPLPAYLDRLSIDTELDASAVAEFVELTIADGGVGIPARLLGSLDVYRDPLPAETELTLRAMRVGASSRPSSVMGRGQGLDTAMRMANRLRGIVVVRTGRLELIRDTTLAAARGQEGWHIKERTHLPGTTVSLLLPWWRGAQAQLGAEAR